MAETQHDHSKMDGMAAAAERFIVSALPLPLEGHCEKLGPGRHQLHVDSDMFGIYESDLGNHYMALRDKLPEMIESLVVSARELTPIRLLNLELPKWIDDARRAGPLRFCTIFHQNEAFWITRIDILFEVTNG